MIALLIGLAAANAPMYWTHPPCPPGSGSSVRGVTTLEEGHLAAQRLRLRRGGAITEVAVDLFHNPDDIETDCRADLEGTIELVVAESEAPPAEWVPSAVLPFAGDAVEGDGRRVVVALPEAVQVPPGSSAWVAIRMRAGSVAATCVRTCRQGGRPHTAWWSHAAAPPYPWGPFADVPTLGASVVMSVGVRVERPERPEHPEGPEEPEHPERPEP